jgi:uncharacterized membrane protein YuzA (DUF378 family)
LYKGCAGPNTGTASRKEELRKVRYVNAIALLLVIVGAANWLLIGLARFDLVATLTGSRFGETNPISTVIYVLVGLAGLWLLPTLARWLTASDDRTAVTAR